MSIADLFTELKNYVTGNKKSVVCGDFNVDFLCNKMNPVSLYLKDNAFLQMINHPTHIQGGLLDHVYTNIQPMYCMIHPIYYSDHDATCVILS